MKKLIILSIVLAVFNCFVTAQVQNDSTVQKSNSNNNGNGKLWEKVQGTNDIYKTPENGNVGIGTDNPITPLDVKGQITTDSLRCHGTLAIGDSSMYLMDNVNINSVTYDQLRSSVGRFSLIRGTNTSTAGFWKISLGIGTQTPQTKQHLYDMGMVDVFTTYTHGTANSANTNGFQIGISANGNAQLLQNRNYCYLHYNGFSYSSVFAREKLETRC